VVEKIDAGRFSELTKFAPAGFAAQAYRTALGFATSLQLTMTLLLLILAFAQCQV
jgi:hypothetical protein